MKRSVILFCLLSLVFSFVACQSEKEPQITVAQATAAFDDDVYWVQTYDASMIDSIRQKMTIEGDITAITHIINSKTEKPNLEWTYIYEFSKEQDAEWFEGDRSSFVANQEGGRCVRMKNIVIYGTSPVIDTIGK